MTPRFSKNKVLGTEIFVGLKLWSQERHFAKTCVSGDKNLVKFGQNGQLTFLRSKWLYTSTMPIYYATPSHVVPIYHT